MTKDEALRMALEALDGLSEPYDVLKAQEAIREALAQPEQEPVAWVCYSSSTGVSHSVDFERHVIDAIPVGTLLYAEPINIKE